MNAGMHINVLGVACFVAMLSNASAAPLKPSLEDRYIATRDAGIERLQPIYDVGNADDVANKAEDAVRVDLGAQMTAILGELTFRGYGPASSTWTRFTRATRVLACSTVFCSTPRPA
jgi:hypothetical protein